jgi:HPt (histidine-containing phosphotransfer) domain-containing protein
LERIKVVEASFTEEEAEELQLLTLDSDGEIENTNVLLNNEPLDGIVSLLVHIKGAASNTGIQSLFKLKKPIPDHPEFKAEITFRNQDNTIETEAIF